MFVYLVQHGESKTKQEDPNRSLTEKGIKDIEKIASVLQKIGVKIEEIFHSGKKRAEQTAEIIAKKISPSKGVKEVEGLAPLDDPNIWFEKLKLHKENVMLVGHLPHLGKLVSKLLCDNSETEIISFTMGSVVCIFKEEQSNNFTIHWMLIPKLLI